MSSPYAEVIGDPISQSKSPAIHTFWLNKLGIAADYRACHVTADNLADYLASRRADPDWRGCNVTMPHKQAVIGLLDQMDPLVRRIGAANTIVPLKQGGLHGANTDAPGFLEPLKNEAFAAVTMIGAGGAARAVLAALVGRGIDRVAIQNRNLEKARALLSEFGLAGDVVAVGERVSPADMLVNTSSLGMAGFPPLPSVERDLVDHGLVYDIVTHPVETPLLRAARARGLRTIDGLSMLIGQAAHAFEQFFGQPAPRQHDGELRELLTR